MPILKGRFKKTTYITLGQETPEDIGRAVAPDEIHPEIPQGLWTKCKKCGSALYTQDLRDNYNVCSKCGYHLRIKANDRIAMVLDEGSFKPWDNDIPASNPLDFPGYEEKLERFKARTGLDEAVLTGTGAIDGQSTVIAVMDASFFMGSMGGVVGEKITRAIERATQLKLPVIIFCCSGGARMQEGMVSLMQMAKTSAALKRHADMNLPYFSVLTDPTTGGVTASFAMLGDVILAEPGALVGFAGPRVIEQTIGQKLPKGFQEAEFLQEHGFVDMIVKREELKDTLSHLIKMHMPWVNLL